MSQEWRNRDPLEDKFFNHSRPDDQVNNMERVNSKVEETRSNLQSNSVHIVTDLMRTVAMSHEIKQKAEQLESEMNRKL